MPEITAASIGPAPRGSAADPSHVGCTYERHRPEETVLYRVLQAEWKTFLSAMELADPPALPAFVVSEVEAFLRCGILAHGLILAKGAATAGAGPSGSAASDAVFVRAASADACATSPRAS